MFDARGEDAVQLSHCADYGMAMVAVRPGRLTSLETAMVRLTALKPTDGPVAAMNSRFALWGVARGRWLLVDASPDPAWFSSKAELLDGNAHLFDLSAAYRLIRLRGQQCERLLQKGLFIDLTPAAFPVGSCGGSVFADVALHLARLGDDCFEVAVPRSYWSSFEHALKEAASAAEIRLGP